MARNRTTPPAADPITLAQAKQHLRVVHAHEDTHKEGLITTETADHHLISSNENSK
jgi:hypothetical protein